MRKERKKKRNLYRTNGASRTERVRSILSTAHVPGFEIVIVSSVPVKRGLGSSSALVVALYTFLETITNMHTGNILEKTLACHMAEKLAVEPHHRLRLADAVTTIVGNEEKILSFDARSLNIDAYDWNPLDVELILIECTKPDFEESSIHRSDATRRKEISTILNTMSRWRTHPDGILPMERTFPRETINTINGIINEDERTSRMIDAIKAERWDKLGRIMKQFVLLYNCNLLFFSFFLSLHSINNV